MLRVVSAGATDLELQCTDLMILDEVYGPKGKGARAKFEPGSGSTQARAYAPARGTPAPGT